jgi:hypothetical protein
MSASGAGGGRVDDLFDRAKNAEDIGGVIFQGLGAILFAIGGALASAILTLADVFIIPARAFIDGAANLVGSVFGGSALIVDLGALGSGQSIGPGGLFASPLSFPIAFGIILLGFYVLLAFTSEEPTTNFFPLVGSGFDVPTPGFTDAEEEEEG